MLEQRELVLLWYWTGVVAVTVVVFAVAAVAALLWERKNNNPMAEWTAMVLGTAGAVLVCGIPVLCILGAYLVGHYFGGQS